MDKKLKRKIIRKLKRFFLYDRSFIKMICFSVVLILILVLGNSFGFVSADEGSSEDKFLNVGDYESSDVYQSDNAYVKYITSNENSVIASNLIMNNNIFDFSGAETPSTFNTSDIKYYLITGSNYPSAWNVYMFSDDNCFSYYNDDSNRIVIVTDNYNTSSGYFYVSSITPWGTGTTLTSPYIIMPTTCARYSLNYFSEVSRGFTSIETSSSNCVVATNMPLYTKASGDNVSMGNHIINFCNNGGGSYDNFSNYSLRQVNYLYGDAYSLGGFDNLEGIGNGSGLGGGDESNETTENNLYLRDSKWTFSMPKWKNLTGYSGNATFSASLNDFQQENLDDFYLDFKFTINTQLSYTTLATGSSGTSGGDHGIDINDNSSATTGYMTGIFKYVDATTNNDYCRVTLQEFYNMGSSKAFMTLNGIFDRCFKVGFSGSTSDTTFVSWYNDYVNSSHYTTTKAILYCYATLYDSSGNASGNCVYYYDLLNGTSGVTDSSMSINDNPYVDEEGNVSGTLPEDDSSGNSITNNNSNSGVNVTQTVNVNNDSSDSKSWLWTLITSLLTSGNDDLNVSEAGMSDTLINLVGINPWISLMSTTFGFIPATVWVTLSAAFIIVMGILVVAFILRIILDLL